MVYEITVERTSRISLEFEAQDEQAAAEKAYEIYYGLPNNPNGFEGGEDEFDFALCDEEGRTILGWG